MNQEFFEEKLDEITNSKNLPGNRIELIKSGEDFLNRVEELILNAKETINLQTFIFEEDETGEFFKDLPGLLETGRGRNTEMRCNPVSVFNKFFG